MHYFDYGNNISRIETLIVRNDKFGDYYEIQDLFKKEKSLFIQEKMNEV